MSSSESSDEEEMRKISEAVSCCESRAELFTTDPADSKSVIHFQKESTKDDRYKAISKDIGKLGGNRENTILSSNAVTLNLKSKRPQHDEDDDDNINNRFILKTTPEFRAYVAKHLENILDKELEKSLMKSVWKKSSHPEDEKTSHDKKGGVKLLSNSKAPIGQNTHQKNQSDLETSSCVKVKKPRLSTSSESSEDEKIQACVFSVDDINEENKRLAALEEKYSPDPEKMDQKVDQNKKCLKGDISNDVSDCEIPECAVDNSIKILKKKKKKKRKKLQGLSES